MSSLVHVVPKEVDGDEHIRDDGTGVDIYAALKAVDARGMRPVQASVDIDAAAAAAPPPAAVDADLDGKSAFVQGAVMARRAELARKQAALVAEAAARDGARADDEAARAAARAAHGDRLRAWASEAGGALRPLRVLLASLHTALWEGARWEPVPMAKLIAVPKVKVAYLRAVTVVHPDKAAGLGPERAAVAAQVFTKLEEAWRAFYEAEMGGAA